MGNGTLNNDGVYRLHKQTFERADYVCKYLGEPFKKHATNDIAESKEEKEVDESLFRRLGGIPMGELRYVLDDIDGVTIKTKDGKKFKGIITRVETARDSAELTVKVIDAVPTRTSKFGIENVVFNNPATIVYWDDGTKTVVTCNDNVKLVKKVVDGKEIEVAKPMKAETYSEEVGLAMAILKKHYGNAGAYNNIFRKYIPGMKEREKAEKKARKAAKREAKNE